MCHKRYESLDENGVQQVIGRRGYLTCIATRGDDAKGFDWAIDGDIRLGNQYIGTECAATSLLAVETVASNLEFLR